MSTLSEVMNPSAEFLRQLPTLEMETETSWEQTGPDDIVEFLDKEQVAFVLELKLVAGNRRFWLCTKGWAGATPHCFPSLIEDYVQPEFLNEQGHWESGEAYGPDNRTFLNGIAYLESLHSERERLESQHERDGSHETAKDLIATRAEIERVIAALKEPQSEEEAEGL
jgi:hypothetical protein